MRPDEAAKIDVPALFDEGRVSLFVWRPESGWPIACASGSARELLGVDPQDLVARGMRFGDFVHPDDLPGIEADLERAVASGGDRFRFRDYRIVRRDGRVAWVEESTRIVRDAAGRVVEYVGHVVDVTSRREAERTVEAQRARLELVLEGSRQGIWDWNPRTGAVTFDERWAEMLGHRLAEIEPHVRAWESRVHPEDLPGCRADLASHLDGRTPFYENVHRMRHRDGHWIWVLDRGKVVERDERGRAVRFTGTHTDITEQKRAELEARRANRAKSRFLAAMSHEIRTPLNGILGLLALLEDGPLDRSRRECVDLIRESGEALLAIINDVLDLSRVEAGRMRIDPHPFEVRDTLGSVRDLYRPAARAKGLPLGLEVDAAVPTRIEADGHRIRQVVSNLVSNAVKFTHRGHVTVAVAVEDDAGGGSRLVVAVEDTGKGIGDTAVIWEPFRQEDASISRRFGGTGLGLAISRRIARLMGGSVEVESAPGEGSRFTLRVPFRPVAESLDAARQAASRDDEAGGREPRFPVPVLVAEDNRINRKVIERTLARYGVRVTLVEDGRQAVEACTPGRFALVLMDIHMPGMDGIAATRAIRERLGPAAPPIVALSADALVENRDACRDAGMLGFVEKPFRREDIERILRHLPHPGDPAAKGTAARGYSRP